MLWKVRILLVEIIISVIILLVSVGFMVFIGSTSFEMDIFGRVSNFFFAQASIFIHSLVVIILASCMCCLYKQRCKASKRFLTILSWITHFLFLQSSLVYISAGLYYSAITNPTTPTRISPFLTFADELPTSSLQINWYHKPITSSQKKSGHKLWLYDKDFSPEITLDDFQLQEAPDLWQSIPVESINHTHHSKLSKLKPGRKYFYKTNSSKRLYYLIAPMPQPNFKFALISDTHARYGVNILLKSFLEDNQPDFVVHGGDFITLGTVMAQWCQMMADHGMFSYLRSRPLLATSGNHELYQNVMDSVANRSNYKNLFSHQQVAQRRIDQVAQNSPYRDWEDLLQYIPSAARQYYDPDVVGDIPPFDEGQYLTLEYGNTFFIVLDCMEDYQRHRLVDVPMGHVFSPEQLKWLNTTLVKYAPMNRPDIKFRVIVSHIGMYTITRAQAEPLPLALILEPYICQYYVDAFVVGHSHLTQLHNRTSVCKELGYPDHSFYAITLGTSGGTPNRVSNLLRGKTRWPDLEATSLSPLISERVYGARDFIYGASFYQCVLVDVLENRMTFHFYKLPTRREVFQLSILK